MGSRGPMKRADTHRLRATARKPRINGEVVQHPSASSVLPSGGTVNVEIERELDAVEADERKELRGGPGDGIAVEPEGKIGPTVLSADDMLFIWRLHQKQLSSRAIARLLSTRSKPVSPATINRFIRRCQDKPDDVLLALKGLRREAV